MDKPLLSIVVVCYNAKYYLQTTLVALTKITKELPVEVILIDNFPDTSINSSELPVKGFKYIHNENNPGFAKANNIGVEHASSDIILILNPDTFISKEVINSALQVLNEQNVVAVKLIDGFGYFLPESYRAFPNLISSFFKLFSLSKLVPGNEKINSYYSGRNKDGTIDVLSGACFFIKKDTYLSIGGFDEAYFMYGEDIDFSYQLKQNNIPIEYIDSLEVVHFKGKSSKKTQWSYLTAFYNAMKIYWDKNLNKSHSVFKNLLVSISVEILKLFTWVKHVILLLLYPLLDFLFIYVFISFIAHFWSTYIKEDANFFPTTFYSFILPLYLGFWIFSLFIQNFYSKIVDLRGYFVAISWGSVLTLLIYYMLPTPLKYSRAILFIFLLVASFVPLFIRYVAYRWLNIKIIYRDRIYLDANLIPNDINLQQLNDTLRYNELFEVILSQNTNSYILDIETLPNEEVIKLIANQQKNDTIWLYSPTHKYLLQSLGQKQYGYIIAKDTNYNISNFSNKVQKRLFDILTSITIIIFSLPLALLSKFSFFKLLSSSFMTLIGSRTWNSVKSDTLKAKYHLRPGVFELENEKQETQFLKKHSLFFEFYFLFQKMFKLD